MAKDYKQFEDDFLDAIYKAGSKEDGKYILTLPQAEQAAREVYDLVVEQEELEQEDKRLDDKWNSYFHD